MNEYISREAVEQVLRGIANGLSVGETNALETKDVKALYKIKGAKEILNTVELIGIFGALCDYMINNGRCNVFCPYASTKDKDDECEAWRTIQKIRQEG